MTQEEKLQPENETLDDTEVNSPVEENIDEDSVSDDPVGDTTDDGDSDDGEESSAKSSKDNGIDPVTRAIAAEREAATYKERLSYLDRKATEAQNQQLEQERMALMNPDERAQYIFEKTRDFIAQEKDSMSRQMRFLSHDAQDRAAFVTKFGHHQAYNKLASQVETKYAEEAAKGMALKREDIFTWYLGQKQVQAILRGTGTKQKNKGASNVAKAKSNGQAGKSDFQKSGGFKANDMSPAAVRARLMAGRSAYNN